MYSQKSNNAACQIAYNNILNCLGGADPATWGLAHFARHASIERGNWCCLLG